MKLKIFLLLILSLVLLAGCAEGKDTEATTEGVFTSAATEVTTQKPGETTSTSTTRTTSASTTELILPASHGEQFAPTKEGIYNYCPSVMELSDGTRYIYYCTNTNSYQIVDYIGCRKGTPRSDGSYFWSEETIVLSPSASGWDSHHACDPSVIAGEFGYNGESYSYLMAYLGCTSYDNQENKIGLAVAKAPEGPFIRVGLQPLIDFTSDPSFTGFQWGVGQPSLISLDRMGHVLLFYTQGDKYGTRLMVDEWKLLDLDSPVKVRTENVSASGLLDLNRGPDHLNNVDLAYDAKAKRFYAASDCHPNPSDEPNYISSHFRLTHFSEKTGFTTVAWSTDATVGQKETGAARNHNTSILRDEYGHLPQRGYVTLYYTVSVTGNTSLWSYRIHDCHIKIK